MDIGRTTLFLYKDNYCRFILATKAIMTFTIDINVPKSCVVFINRVQKSMLIMHMCVSH